jgi:hypothetical protein
MAEKETKYSKYIIRDTLAGNGFPPYAPRMLFDTKNYFPEMGFGIRYTYITQPINMEKPHSHDFDQFFCFMGSPEDMRIFDGEVEVYLGEEQIKHIINSTSVLYVPKGMVHTPFNWVKVNKPMMFINIVLSNQYTRTAGDNSLFSSLEYYARKVTLEEAGRFLGVTVPLPAYLPQGCKIQEIYIQDDALDLIISDRPTTEKRLYTMGDAKGIRQIYSFEAKWDLKIKCHPQGYAGKLDLPGVKMAVGDNPGILVDRERNLELNWLQRNTTAGQFELALSVGKGVTTDELLKVACSIK